MFAHIDADAFFASVLMRKHPHLRGKPLLAAGMGGGCVIAASYEAKAKGVKTGMRITEARKLCPEAIEMPSDFAETGIASSQIEGIMKDTCPIIEKMSIDEWYLNLSSIPGGKPNDLTTWMQNLQKSTQNRVGISVSIGVAPSKLLAKMASEYRKPGGLTIVHHQNNPMSGEFSITIPAFLTNRPAAAISGIGPRRQAHAERYRWKTAWDIALADSELIKKIFGRPGLEMQQELRGSPVHQVVPEVGPPKSISRCRSFKRTNDQSALFAHLLNHLSYTILKMRRQQLSSNHIVVWLRDGNYRHFSKDTKLTQRLQTEEEMLPYIKRLFQYLYLKNQFYTQAGLTLCNLGPTSIPQFSLFDSPQNLIENEDIQQALDALHQQFGRDSIVRGSALPVKSGTKREVNILSSSY